LKLLLDEMFSPAIAAELRDRGHDVVAIKEHPEWQAMPDRDIVALARREQRVIVTKDIRDFRPLHAELVTAEGPGHPGMVFVPASISLAKAATGQVVSALEAKLAEYPGDEDLANGETWV
jgi:hypothetical protein